MYTEDDYIQLSALQHYVFCPRQCGLIHVEDVWADNVFTVRGEILHEKVDTDTYETRLRAETLQLAGTRYRIKTVRGLRIHSTRLGIVGRADVVEFRKSTNVDGSPDVLPVEFKSGEPKEDVSDKVQLCAQALCLEEMMNTQVKRGAFFYGKIRRRVQVELDDELRRQTEEIITAVHEIVSQKKVPAARYNEKCRNCSLEETCMPKAMNEKKLKKYIEELYNITPSLSP